MTIAGTVQKLFSAVQSASASELARLLDEHADVAAYNARRESVQVWCAAGLIANIPLEAHLSAALLAHTGSHGGKP
jgi:hypothetical protein